MFKHPSSHPVAVLQALLVTFLWSTSWVLIKIGLGEIPALTFAGLRYSLAFLCLLPFSMNKERRVALSGLSTGSWARLLSLGFLFYALTQGAQFVSLDFLPAVTVSLALNFTVIVVALLGIFFLAELPLTRQWLGIWLSIGGAMLYFYPLDLPAGQAPGFVAAIIGVLANAASSVLGRSVNRGGEIQPLTVTVISMCFGGGLLLVSGILIQGLPRLTLLNWGIVAWLAVINTAFAFTLWNHTLRTLSAMESSLINNTMLIQIALLAWFFLGEQLSGQEIAGMVIVALGVMVVQLGKRPPGKQVHH